MVSSYLVYIFSISAGNPASSDYVKQELRAVVSGRAAAAANSGGGNGVPGGGGAGGGNGPGGGSGGIPGGLRVATPQSPLGPQTPQGSMQHGTNNTNPMTMGGQQPQTSNSAGGGNGPNSGSAGVVGSSSSGGGVNSMLQSPDPTIGFSFDTRK